MNNFQNFQPYTYNSYQRRPLMCYNCGQYGHKARNCYYYSRMGYPSTQYYYPYYHYNHYPLTCYNCGGIGHKKAVCPSLPRKSFNSARTTTTRSSLIQKPLQKPIVSCNDLNFITSHSDYIYECKLLKMSNYKQFSDEELKKRILAYITQNLNYIEKFPKNHQLKFLARHDLIPRDQLEKLQLSDELIPIIMAALKHEQDDKKRFNSVAEKTGEKVYAGGTGRRLMYRLDNGSTGDYNIDVSNMLQSPCIAEDFKLQFSKGGPFQVKPIITFTVDWIQRETTEQYYKHLPTSYKVVHESDITNILPQIEEEIKLMIRNSQEEGSGWVYISFDKLEFSLRDWKPGTGASYIKLPPQIGRGYRNIMNNDEYCFKYAVALSLRNSRLGDGKNNYLPTLLKTVEQYDFSCLQFPVACDKSLFEKFERKNLDTDLPGLNVFVLNDYEKDLYPLPYYTSKVKDPHAKDAINLMFFQGPDEEDKVQLTGHYCVIINMSRAFTKLTKKTITLNVCVQCLFYTPLEEKFQEHIKYCNMSSPCRLKMPELCNEKCNHPCTKHKNKCYFRNTQYEQCLPVIIVADTESLCKSVNTCKSCNKNFDKTEIKQHYKHGTILNEEHVPIGYKYYVYVDPKYREVFHNIHGKMVTHTGEQVGSHMLESLITDVKEIYQKIANTTEKISLANREEWKSKFVVNETECHICEKVIKTHDKHLDHDHLTGEVRGWSHPTCNWRHTIKRYEIPVVFHNFKNYDSKAILKERSKFPDVQFDIIGQNCEKIKTLKISAPGGVKFKFVDSLLHMSKSLEKLVESVANYDAQKFATYDEYVQKTDVAFLRKQFPETSAHFPNDKQFKMMIRKGVFPYNWFNDQDKLQFTSLIPKDEFYNQLKEEHISEEQYKFYKAVWKEFKMTTFHEYYDLYLTTDVLLLTDICAWYKQESLYTYGLDPFWFLTSPSMAWNAMLKISREELELLTDVDMHNFFKQGLRGGLAFIGNKYAKANNPKLKDYDPTKPTSYIKYFDLNNLYGYCMMQKLPVGKFKWIKNPRTINPKCPKNYGYTYEVDIEYPAEFHDAHNDYPAAPENFKPPGSQHEKLVNHFNVKKNYVANWQILKMYQDMGCKITKIHRGIQYKVKSFMKSYLELNTNKRKLANNDFLKDYYKLMNNSVFGRTIMNKMKFGDYEIANAKRYKKLMRKPHMVKREVIVNHCDDCQKLGSGEYGNCNQDIGCSLMVEKHKRTVTLDQPIYVGVTITDLAKLRMYEFWNKMKAKYGDKIKLLMSDTDSFVVHWECEDINKELTDMKEEFDFSNYAKDHPLYCAENKKVPGKMKDEYPDKEISEFVGLRAKCYSVLFDDETDCKTAKGIHAKRKLRHQDYKDILQNRNKVFVTETTIRSHEQTLYTETHTKKALCVDDDKRIWIGNDLEPFSTGFGDTLAWGHYSTLLNDTE